MHKVKLVIAGTEFYGWTSVTINRSIDTACSSFTLVTTDGAFDEPIETKKVCQIYIDNELMLTGKIDKYTEAYSSSSHTVTVTGRSLTSVLVDGSSENTTSFTAQQDPTEIASKLVTPKGINLIARDLTDLKKYKGSFEVKDGESVYEALHRLAELQQFTITDNENGDLVLWKITRETTTESGNVIIKATGSDDTNVKECSFSEDITNCFSKIIVKGQEKGSDTNHGKKTTAKKAVAKVKQPSTQPEEDVQLL